MRIADARVDGIVAVAPAGRIDTTTAPALEQHLVDLLTRGERRIVIDLSGVEYISSAGLRVMLLVARRVGDVNGRLGLCAMADSVRQVFQLAGFLPLFAVQETRDAAVQQIAAP
jgi:stage II sporulation protein AA (anti-sigma F factor antagonist)